MTNHPKSPIQASRRSSVEAQKCIEHCGWCNQDYDFFTQASHCPHDIKPQPPAPSNPECFCGLELEAGICPNGHDPARLLDEVDRRKDAVVDAAVAWHQSGREGDETWFDKAEILGRAIDELLGLREPAPTSAQARIKDPDIAEALTEYAASAQAGPEPNKDRSRLIQIAGAIAVHLGFVSPYVDDHSAHTPRAIIKQAEKQEERLKDWAYEIRQIADRMPVAAPTPTEPTGYPLKTDREAWLLGDVSFIGRDKIDTAQYVELRDLAVRLHRQLAAEPSVEQSHLETGLNLFRQLVSGKKCPLL